MKIYRHQESFLASYDPCLNCSCTNSIVRCIPIMCPNRDFPCRNPVRKGEGCCQFTCPSEQSLTIPLILICTSLYWQICIYDLCDLCTGFVCVNRLSVAYRFCVCTGSVCVYRQICIYLCVCFCQFYDLSVYRQICIMIKLCDVYTGCVDGGREYYNGDTWPSPRDPCQVCQCSEGIVTCKTNKTCMFRCTHGVIPQGKCCSDCRGKNLRYKQCSDSVKYLYPRRCLRMIYFYWETEELCYMYLEHCYLEC